MILVFCGIVNCLWFIIFILVSCGDCVNVEIYIKCNKIVNICIYIIGFGMLIVNLMDLGE